MVCFPNAKINIGLNIIEKRPDGFHNIETVFYPIQLGDVLEFVPSASTESTVHTTGIGLGISGKENLCYKAYDLLSKDFRLPPIEIHLHKIIPSGAGLGGGSSDAAFLLKELNATYKLNLTTDELERYAAKLGSDCSFFIQNKPVFAHGRGEKFQDIELDLSGYYIYLIKPDVFVSTPEAYSGVTPSLPNESLKNLTTKPVADWRKTIVNDFEFSIFKKYPLLGDIKDKLYQHGAVYSAMSGSGSSIYGIFTEEPQTNNKFENYFTWISKL